MRIVCLFRKKQIGLALAALALILGGTVSMDQAALGQDQTSQVQTAEPDKAQRKQQLLEQLKVIQQALKELEGEGTPALKTAPAVVAAPKEEAAVLPPVEVLGSRIEHNPEGRAISKVDREEIENTRAFSLKEMMELTPGLSIIQGNGPRDVNISIRGSGAKNSFGIRNIKFYEDWFPTTQADGLSRTDTVDPHALAGFDIIRGPSSSLYDNYAIGGVVNFRTRLGRDIQGFEVGNDGGSRGYQNHWLHIGDQLKYGEYSVFGSDVRSDGFIRHSAYNTSTENGLASFSPDEKRTITFKFINNDLSAQVPSRLTKNQFYGDPRSAGLTSVTGVGTVTAEQAGQQRRDRRTIGGARYEQAIDANTGLSLLASYDVKDIHQPFGTISDNINSNFHTAANLTHEGSVFGLRTKHYFGAFFEYMDIEQNTFFNAADGNADNVGESAHAHALQKNIGARLREEVQFNPQVTGVAGAGFESTNLSGQQQSRALPTTATFIPAQVDRTWNNVAPEAALIYKHSPDLQMHARVGTAYGTPQFSNLTTGPDGNPGNNFGLKPQRVVGYELGVDGRPIKSVTLSLTGFYEFFSNELITYSTATGASFTSNAPNANHRGVEAALDWRIVEGWRLTTAYTFNDFYYTNFNEQISGTYFNWNGKQIPNVVRNFSNTRLRYESPYNVGAWLEMNWQDDFFVNNANTLKTNPYTIFNLDVHYNRELPGPYVKGMSTYFEVMNLFNTTYIGSTAAVSTTVGDTPFNVANSKQSFFSGDARGFFAGLKLKF